MGKKARKTRWRALTIADELSDSETSSTTTAPRLPNVFQTQKTLSNRYTYSSQSTPRRRYQYDSTKSTRSSSTASENKMAFNEDDYTKISTPRQDVLFKKGYLNKPRNYHTQTSTGTSTNSTGNSTGNGTPDYQSTDLEYESQFVFPNGFVDHNGFYYINGYDYPFMFYNVPTYYHEYSNYESKRHSSGSLTESTSPHNEEVTSQDLSGGEASNSHSDTGSGHRRHHHHQPLTNHHSDVHSNSQNGIPSSHDVVNGECPADQTRKIKKRRRRRTTSPSAKQDSTENSDEEQSNEDTSKNIVDSNENVLDQKPSEKAQEESEKIPDTVCENVENILENRQQETNEGDSTSHIENETPLTVNNSCPRADSSLPPENQTDDVESSTNVEINQNATVDQEMSIDVETHIQSESPKQPANANLENSEHLTNLESSDHSENPNQDKTTEHFETVTPIQTNTDTSANTGTSETASQDQQTPSPKYDLKPDAKEFVPRAYRTPDIPLSPVQFINLPGNFVPLPLFPFNGQNFNPAFLPPGIPINFVRPDPKMFPNFMGFPHNGPLCNGQEAVYNEEHQNGETQTSDDNSDNSNTANEDESQKSEADAKEKPKASNKTIDIATVVSKLEVAAKEQEQQQNIAMSKTKVEENAFNHPNKYQRHHRFKNNVNYKGNYYNRSQNSPQRELKYRNRDRQNGEASYSHLHNHPQDIEVTNTNNSVCRENYTQVSHTNSPSTPNIDSAKSSPFRPNPQTTRNTQSPLRQIVSQNGSPYKQTGPVPNKLSDVKTGPPNLLRRSPEKTKPAWKQPYFKNNKWKPNNPTYDNRNKNVDSGVKVEVICKNYSDTSKANANKKFNEDVVIKQTKNFIKTEVAKAANLPQETLTAIPPSPNQWISVQKRKKRKNKNAEEVDNFPEDEVDDDQFESYDVNSLIDVVVAEKKETDNLENKNNDSEESKDSPLTEEVLVVVVETEVTAVEKIATTDDEDKEPKVIVEETEVQNEIEAVISDVVPEVSEATVVGEEAETVLAKDKKKKSKKNSQKSIKKKVIIKDIDLSDQFIEPTEPVGKVVAVVKNTAEPIPSTSQECSPKEEIQQEEATKENEEAFEKEQSPESVKSSEQDEKKKSKKKKKKPSKAVTNSTASNSDSFLGSVDDTFDFLDSVLTNETEDKTNDEISQELDKIIQKGMLNSIEEKIKSLNIDESDGFFKSVWTKLSRKETSMGYTKIPVFSEILKPSAKPNSVSREVDLQNTKCNEILSTPDSVEPTTEDGLFLENAGIVDVLEDDRKQPTASPDDESIETKKDVQEDHGEIAKHEIEIGEIEQPNTLYPITKAVKEWMCRTRETTPDVELLKSPSKIFEEFCDISDSDTDTEIGDDPVIKFSKEQTPSSEVTADREQSIEQPDLLEYWEDDVKNVKTNDANLKLKPDAVKTVDEDDDEELPVYESKYGKNEDFLTIQRKIRQRNGQLDRSSPTHTTLPQRAAVCCNIM